MVLGGSCGLKRVLTPRAAIPHQLSGIKLLPQAGLSHLQVVPLLPLSAEQFCLTEDFHQDLTTGLQPLPMVHMKEGVQGWITQLDAFMISGPYKTF